MYQKLIFYIRLDYRAIYIGYRYPNGKGHEINYSPSGYEFMQSIIEFLRVQYDILVGRWTVERLLTKSKDYEKDCIEIRGRNLTTGLPDTVCVSLQLINDNLSPLIKSSATIIELNLKHNISDEIYTELLKSELISEKGDFPLPQNFIPIFEEQLPIPIVQKLSTNNLSY